MKVLEIMERAGTITSAKKIIAYVNDGLDAIARIVPEKVTRQYINVVAGTRYYALTTDIAKILGIYRKKNTTDTSSTTKYIRIPLITTPEVVEST